MIGQIKITIRTVLLFERLQYHHENVGKSVVLKKVTVCTRISSFQAFSVSTAFCKCTEFFSKMGAYL